MNITYGIETEYGIFVEGKGPSDLIQESISVVRSYAGRSAGPWDYRAEDPRRDMRGYRVDHLTHNPDDARYDRPAPKPMSMQEERSDHVLTNGARLYNDHGHPEYATPECSSLRSLVAHDRAGERIVQECARIRSSVGAPVTIYKNNSDYDGMSYGCHESYLFPRSSSFEAIFQGMLPFLVTRQIYAGAGKVGAEVRASSVPIFQLSQRADFFTVEASVDTLHQRPIFNTRDEPHADPRQHRRLHVICGDANLSEYATALKVGTTAAVLELVRRGWKAPFTLANPVAAIQNISRDQSWQWFVTLDSGKTVRATEVQAAYLQAALSELDAAGDKDLAWVVREWDIVLRALERDPLELSDRVDWVAKRALLEEYLKAEGLDWSDPLAQSLDLEYHNIDPQAGLYYGLEEAGAMVRLVSEEEIKTAVGYAPESSRAWIRGELVRRFPETIKSVSWGRIALEQEGQSMVMDLSEWAAGVEPGLRERLDRASTLGEWVGILRSSQ